MLDSGSSVSIPRSCACQSKAAEPIRIRFPGCERRWATESIHSATCLPFFSSRRGIEGINAQQSPPLGEPGSRTGSAQDLKRAQEPLELSPTLEVRERTG